MQHLQTIQQVFSDKLLQVPDYQRGYAWDERQWQDLIEDLEVLQIKQEHYTGTLVLHHDSSMQATIDEEGNSLDIYNVVDGQQRLTTIIILLNCISKMLGSMGGKETLAGGIRKNYIQITDLENQQKARLTLNPDCHDYFFNNIISLESRLEGPIIKAHERLYRAQKFFWHYLDNKRKQDPVGFEPWIIDLHKKITNYLKLTVYQVPNSSDVGVIFEVMNNRGKPLSEMEKVKNYLLYLSTKIPLHAAEELGKSINKAWAFIFQRLMEANASSTDSENQLLRSSWLMAYSYFTRNWKGYASVKERFNLKDYQNDLGKLLEGLNAYVETLNQSCIAYCDVINPNHDESYKNFLAQPDIRKQMRKKTEKIQRIGNTASFLPLIMAARMKYADDSDFLGELLDICEKYSFRIYRWHNYRSHTGQSTLFRFGHDLYHGRISKNGVLNRIKRLLLHYSSHEDYISEYEKYDKNWYNFTGLKYFLYEYEEYLARGKGILLPWNKLVKTDKKESIEHILPQTPDYEYWRSRWEADELDLFTHDIGNLTLTLDNSVYSNKPFPEKKGAPGLKDCYAASIYFQEKELAVFDDWTPAELKKRRQKIVDWARERWYVEADFSGEIELEDEEYEVDGVDDEENGRSLDELADGENDQAIIATKRPKLKEWSEFEINEYFDYLKTGGECTYAYFKILAETDAEVSFDEMVKKIREETGRISPDEGLPGCSRA